MDKTKFYEALSLIGKIEDRVSLEQYMVDECGSRFRNGGSKNGHPILMCDCPLHNESSPSFALYTHNQSWFCFGGCGGGKLINFVQKQKKWNWFSTIFYFADKLHLSCNFSEEDVIGLIEDMYNKHYVTKIDEFNPTNVNYFVSAECKKISDKYGTIRDINSNIESIYKITDKAIVEKDSGALFRIKEEIMPMLIEKVRVMEEKEKMIEKLGLENKTCTKCFLHSMVNKIVVGEGNVHSSLAIIGEAPGKDEDEQGRPFVGLSGQVLRNTIKDLGVDEKALWIDNVSDCRPPDNKFIDKEAMFCKKNWLLKRFSIIKPKHVMLMGNNAAKTFLEDNSFSISSYIGKAVSYDLDGHNIMLHFNYHPSYILRKGGIKEGNEAYSIFKEQLKIFLSFLAE